MKKTVIKKKLAQAFSQEAEYRPILEALAVVGVAETPQLMLASEQARDKLRRSLDKLEALGCVHPLRESIRRNTGRGRSTKVWRLGEAGALIVAAKPGKLENARAITHALAMLDIHLAAKQTGQNIVTDKVIHFEGGTLRPDHLVESAAGQKMLFEIEQDAGPRLLRRILRSLRNKIAFFSSPEGKDVSPVIRMLITLPPGTAYEKTLGIWLQALDILLVERKEAGLPFQLFALPLSNFLDNPHWDETPDPARWTVLTTRTEDGPQKSSLNKSLAQIPRQKAEQDRIILAALLQSLRENETLREKAQRYPTPDPHFFGSMASIYSASYDESLSEIELAAYPWASLFLLKQYLHLHPVLRKRIDERLRAGTQRMSWNTTIILHRMQTVVELFLAYHGWRSDGGLLAYAETPPWNTPAPRSFQVFVKIRHAAVLVTDDGLLPHRDDLKLAEESLAWVLAALFRYSPDLGFKAAPFW